MTRAFPKLHNNRAQGRKALDEVGACSDWGTSKRMGNGEALIILENNLMQMMRAIPFTAAISVAGMCLGQDQSLCGLPVEDPCRWGAPCEHCQSYVDGF
ncbi:MAG: hypothetical protein IPJ85_07315 [Flavobacteriales bacterium]|nr:hypothetical protein [Flavobacteriales bacterium]